MRIQTIGNKCFHDSGACPSQVIMNNRPCNSCRVTVVQPTAPVPVQPIKPITQAPRKKPERVNLKFGKIRVNVTNADRVDVSQDGTTMTIQLRE